MNLNLSDEVLDAVVSCVEEVMLETEYTMIDGPDRCMYNDDDRATWAETKALLQSFLEYVDAKRS